MSHNDSSSDDDAPIKSKASTRNDGSASASTSDSSSDDDIPIGQLSKNKTKPSSDDDSSSSGDDAPLVARRRVTRSTSTSSSSSKSKPTRSTSRRRGSKSKSKKRKRFRDSDNEDSDSSSDSDDDEPIVSAAHKRLKKPPRKRPRRSSASSSTSSSSSRSPRTPKTRKRRKTSSPRGSPDQRMKPVNDASSYAVKASLAPLEPLSGALKWWEHEDDNTVGYKSETKEKWRTLDHNGVVFAPPYVAHGQVFKYDGEEVRLSADQEEVATMYAVMLETDYAQKERFNKNFFTDWKKLLRDKTQSVTHTQITDLAKCDFKGIHAWYQLKREAEKEKRKDPVYKKRVKAEKEEFDGIFGYALVDGIREKVGNFKVEPPGLFRGRGEHPKMGMLKNRTLPRDIVLNIGENTPIPECPIAGQQWGGVVHDNKVTYLAKWIDNINGSHKFVYLGASSRFKGQNDRNKYEKARVLKTKIVEIRRDYGAMLTSKSLAAQQLATAVWMIDILSIRVGNEKDTDEEADTVGVCSLRKEHIELLTEPTDVESTDKDAWQIKLDFLGKDSMRHLQTCSIPRQIYYNLRKFLKGKMDDVDIFEMIDPDKMNKYLKSKMDGLTAKVFRTHNASTTLQKELAKGFNEKTGKITVNSTLEEKKFFYDTCNREVAILCNHQRSVSANHGDQLMKMDQGMENIREAIEEMQEQLDEINGVKRKKKKKSKKKDKEGEEKKKSPKKTPKKKTKEVLEAQIKRKKDMLRKKELAKALKEDNKEASLGTSKINYMDPRVTVAWCKKMQVPIEKIFNRSLLDKFPWAMQSNTKYHF